MTGDGHAAGGAIRLAVAGATLQLEVSGPADAPAVLLWHGAWCTLRMWDQAVARIEDQFRCLRFDVRGVGRSSPSADPGRYSLEQYAADAVSILDALGIERCHVWSMAWGSRAALAFVSLHPERVISAALFDASIGVADVEAQKAGARAALEKQLAQGIERFERPEGWNTHAHPDEVPKALAAAGSFDLPTAASRLAVPALVATGDHDPNLESSRELVDRATKAELVVLENVGHGSVLQRPDLAVATFLAFQARLPAA